MRRLTIIALSLLAGAAPAAAQRQIATPEQRIERLERQLRQVQGRIFPKGQPVETAGFLDEPAASQTVVVALSNRIDNLERQLAEATRRAEDGSGRIAALEAELARVRRDSETRLRSSSFPGHRRVSWANNLVGRALLDSGQPRAAAEALLANYRGNPKGERAPDSLYYLGQALFALKQPSQACKAYSELEEVYGASIRAELKALLPPARGQAGCR
jgi:TolA-binding protein